MIFDEAAKAKHQSESLDIDQMIEMLKARKKENDIQFDMQMGQLNMAKLESDSLGQAVKGEEKRNKIQSDLISSVVKNGQSGPTAIGGNMLGEFIPEATQESQGLPILEGIGG